jgi:hypothetical protein
MINELLQDVDYNKDYIFTRQQALISRLLMKTNKGILSTYWL